MTVRRIILILLWILSLVGISFYGGPVSYGFFAAVTFAPAVSLLYTLFVLFRFKIYQELSTKNVTAGSVSGFYITLQNEDILAHSGIKVNFYSPFSSISGMDESAEYELAPHSGIRKETSLLCRYRGEYEVGVKSIVIRDYLKIFRITFKNREPFRLRVMPAIIRPDVLKTIDSEDTTSVESRAHATETDVVVRNYIPGDEVRKIHWKASASRGKLLVRNTYGEEKQGIGIIMDSERYSLKPEEYLPLENKISETVIALSVYFQNSNTPVNVYSYNDKVSDHFINDPGSFRQFYSYISGLRFDGDSRISKLLLHLEESRNIYSHRMVIMVLHSINGEVMAFVSRLLQNDISPVIYLVTDDQEEIRRSKSLFAGYLFVIPTEADLKEVL